VIARQNVTSSLETDETIGSTRCQRLECGPHPTNSRRNVCKHSKGFVPKSTDTWDQIETHTNLWNRQKEAKHQKAIKYIESKNFCLRLKTIRALI
jgi:hypothetical protein